MGKPAISFEDLYQLGGHMRHRRISGRFYSAWSGDFDSSAYNRAVKNWYLNKQQPKKALGDAYTKLADSEETSDANLDDKDKKRSDSNFKKPS